MSGKIKPLKTEQGELIKSIDDQITNLIEMRSEIKGEMGQYWKLCEQESGGIKGIDYSSDKISGGSLCLCFSDIISRINGLQNNLERIQDNITQLQEKRKKLIMIYKKDTTVAGRVFFYREVSGLSQEKTAEKIGYSVRQIQRIERNLKNKYGVRF